MWIMWHYVAWRTVFIGMPQNISTEKELAGMAVPSAFNTYMKYYDLRDQRF